jgi:retinol dehydrogenase-12
MQKIIVITGGSSGLGYEAARQLLQKGHAVYFIGRDQGRCEKAATSLKNNVPGAIVKFFIADLSSQKEIRRVQLEIKSATDHIDVLINNAGAIFHRFTFSDDGIEKTFALNHLAYFLLTHYLKDIIPAGGRIINVASDSHFSGKMDFDSLQKEKNYRILKAYAQSKLGNMLFTYELARRLVYKNITVNAISPGRVRTHIGNKNQPWHLSVGWNVLTFFSSITPEKSVETFVMLALDDKLKNTTGKYFHACAEKKSSAISYDVKLARELWVVSEKLAGL